MKLSAKNLFLGKRVSQVHQKNYTQPPAMWLALFHLLTCITSLALLQKTKSATVVPLPMYEVDWPIKMHFSLKQTLMPVINHNFYFHIILLCSTSISIFFCITAVPFVTRYFCNFSVIHALIGIYRKKNLKQRKYYAIPKIIGKEPICKINPPTFQLYFSKQTLDMNYVWEEKLW